MDDYTNYEQMRAAGATAEQVYLAAEKSGADFAYCIRMLRKLFGLRFEQAKEVIIIATGRARSLSEHEEAFLEPLKRLLSGKTGIKESSGGPDA